jgi:hypothetical protein
MTEEGGEYISREEKMNGGRPGGCFSPDQKPGSGKSILRFAIRSSRIIEWYREVIYVK